ncbi:uncharacterized protein [Onthophagus taurus]|uniref:uncharacterized protein isoform X1 n=1 Tax=Onthophagus taurus TaxID=166361 RepID=UPI0039BE7E12
MTELNNLPPGWDTKVDRLTGKRYYINHHTKTTTWEDPRNKHRGNGEYIPLQHGTPDTRRNYIYPSQPSPKPAFQISGHSPKYIPLKDVKPSRNNTSLRPQQTQESTLTISQETDESVAKISSMFPTVSDTHIRLLLKKYHNREAVVISALQVEKHPIATPGPFATPPPARSIFPGIHPSLQMTPPLGVRSYSSRGGSPITRFGSFGATLESPRVNDHPRNRPHSSPKLKLRYMKSIFPKAEETVILDVLTSNENNIQKASDTLKGMGYERRDPVKLLQQQEAEAKREEEEKARQNEAVETIEILLIPKIKTPEEKDRIKISLQEQYKDITEQVITIALESVEYDETKACQILQIMVQEDADNKEENTEIKDTVDSLEEEPSSLQPQINIPISQSRHSFKSLIAEKSEVPSKDKNIPRIFVEENCNKMALGANPNYAKGPKDELLLLDYAPWDGPNENLRCGPKKGLAKGPNKNNLSNRDYKSFGPNPDLRKGAKVGLAKGSMFKQFRNIVIGESRGK